MNAPVKSEHKIATAALILLLKQVKPNPTTQEWEETLNGFAQALANLEARIARKAWLEGHMHTQYYPECNPYPDLDAP